MQLSTLSSLSPLGSVLIDVERSIRAQLYYPALLVTLTIPEICSGLLLDNSIFIKEKHYVSFVDKYATPSGLGLSGIECYRLRGGVVHRANMAGHPNFGYANVCFTIPETVHSVHGIAVRGPRNAQLRMAIMLDLVSFCRAMVHAAHKWYDDYKGDAMVLKNMPSLIRYCPKGLAPYFGGAPIVASGE
jgi:hypothetical protein